MYKIEIDDRERAVAPYFNTVESKLDINYEVKKLTTGDYSIWIGNFLKVIIERKTWEDLDRSIIDGRLESQLENMMEIKSKYNSTCFLIIEGSYKRSCRIEKKGLIKKLDRIMLQNTAYVIFTTSISNTVERIIDLCEAIEVDKIGGIEAKNNVLTEPRVQKDNQVLRDMFTSISGVGPVIARVFMMANWSLLKLYNSNIEDITKLTYPSGSHITSTIAEKILNSIKTKDTLANIISCINGITKQKAELILEKIPDPNNLTVDIINTITIVDPKNNKSKKINNKLSSKIESFFNLVIES